ncbi:MAG: hypothetical protein ACK4TA_04040 [Saprospiraceae bacterium]
MKNVYFLVISMIISCALQAQHGHHTSTDKASVHGMVLFGNEQIYASHLPLFHTPHHYQIILRLEPDAAARQIFLQDQQAHPAFATYTIEPERFILPDKIQQQGSFKANLYRGHFERGGIRIADSLHFKIAEVIYFKQFDPRESKATDAKYLLFGNAKQQFAVHQISNKPDFEQIIEVKSDFPLGKCEIVRLAPANNPIGISGNIVAVPTPGGKANIMLLKQLYLEFDDLKE